MPIYEYYCGKCSLLFEVSKPIIKYDSEEKCRMCGQTSKRMISSEVGISVKGESSHKTVDQVVGEDAAKRWQQYHDRKSEKDKIRAKSGSGALVKKPDGSYAAAPKEIVEHRNKIGEQFATALSEHRVDREKKGIPASDTMKPEE